jgi:5-(carboxyamino)imidazole ribonucleotide synthase
MTHSPTPPILPGATVGVFGSGQLGRMLTFEAIRMGYRVATFSPRPLGTPTGQAGSAEMSAGYDDQEAIRAFVRGVDVLTFEFENVAAHVAEIAAAEGVPVRPGGHVLHTAQNRLREKRFFVEAGLPVAPFAPVHSLADLTQALEKIGIPAVLKTAAFGYDGKGQVRIDDLAQAQTAWDAIGQQPAVLEGFIDFEREVSVVAARGVDGSFAHYGVMENLHADHILDVSIAPGRVDPEIVSQAAEMARTVLVELGVIGVLCVEFFVTRAGRLLVNEIAPRPHNSGHLTIEGAITSQFEQQVRAICGLPLGTTTIHRPTVMVNLLGDLWQNGEPDWAGLLAVSGVKLHLYGKADPHPGRKMGHFTVQGDDVEESLARALSARQRLVE